MSTPTEKAPTNVGEGSGGEETKPKFPGTPKVHRVSPGSARAERTMKRPAAAATPKKTLPKKTTTPKKKTTTPEKNILAFPGTAKRKPLEYGRSVVYFSPGRYRLMACKGVDKVDKGFSHKGVAGPREAWRKLVKELRRLNPKV